MTDCPICREPGYSEARGCPDCGHLYYRRPEPETVKASAYWASYLINNDASGLDDGELAVVDAWLIRHGLSKAEFVDVGEPYFSWSYGAETGAAARGGDLADYTVIRHG